MANAGVRETYDEKLASFYLERLCLEADHVFRFAFALTLSRAAAFECVKYAYRKATGLLVELAPLAGGLLRMKMLGYCLDGYRQLHTEYPVDDTGLVKVLTGMDEKARIVLMLVDAGMMTPAEVGDLLGENEIVIRKSLAQARKHLVALAP